MVYLDNSSQCLHDIRMIFEPSFNFIWSLLLNDVLTFLGNLNYKNHVYFLYGVIGVMCIWWEEIVGPNGS